MKTEEHLELIGVFIQRVTAAVSELKDHLQREYERAYPDLGEIIRIVLDEEEARAWELSFFPHLFLPDMVEAHIANLNLQPVEMTDEDVFEQPTSTNLNPIQSAFASLLLTCCNCKVVGAAGKTSKNSEAA